MSDKEPDPGPKNYRNRRDERGPKSRDWLSLWGGALLSLIMVLALSPGASAHAVSGVVDAKGRVVIACKYKTVRQLKNGFFLLEEFDSKNVWNRSFSCLLSNRDGKMIQPRLPTGFTLTDVILPDSLVSTKLSVLPKETILKIHDENGFALSDLAGHLILVPDQYLQVESLNEGMFEIWKLSHRYLFNALTRTKVPLSVSFNTGQFENGVIRFYGRNSHGNYIDKDGGYLDKAGHVVFKGEDSDENHIKLDDFGPFYNQVATAKLASRFGLVNRKFEWVTATSYASIRRLFADTYAVQSSDNPRFIAINSSGKEIFAFPKDVISIISAGEDYILCESASAGKTDPNWPNNRIFKAFDKRGELAWTYKACSMNQLPKTKTVFFLASTINGSWQSKYIDSKGQPAVSLTAPRGVTFIPLDSDRMIKLFDEDRFSSTDWKDRGTTKLPDLPMLVEREKEFVQLLRDYNLIGMTREQLFDLLGQPEYLKTPENIAAYYILAGDCGVTWEGIELQFENNKVKQWRMSGGATVPWITTNVLISDGWRTNGVGNHLVQKNAAP